MWKEGISTEGLSLSAWPVGKSVGDWYGWCSSRTSGPYRRYIWVCMKAIRSKPVSSDPPMSLFPSCFHNFTLSSCPDFHLWKTVSFKIKQALPFSCRTELRDTQLQFPWETEYSKGLKENVYSYLYPFCNIAKLHFNGYVQSPRIRPAVWKGKKQLAETLKIWTAGVPLLSI